MKVALLTREYPPDVYGGAGVHVEYLSRELAHRVGVAVHCFGDPRDDPLVAATYQPWAALGSDGPGAALRTMSVDLAMAGGVGDVDVVHSHTWYANLAGHLTKLLHGVPHVMTAHSLEPFRPWKAEQLGAGYALSSFCERTGIEGADAVIAVSGAMRADVLAAYPSVDPDRVQVIHNGIDPEQYRPIRGSGVLERLGIDAERPIVAFIGRMTRQKGIAHLLDAAAAFAPEAQLVCCAGAPDTPEIGAELRAQVGRLRDRRDGVFWIEEMLGREGVVALLGESTVFVCPSIYEPFGLINIEAMACGVPVVATAVGGIPEIVVDGETGTLIPFEPSGDTFGTPADPGRLAADLAAAVNRLLADRTRAAAWGAAGRRRVLDQFSWTAIADRTVELYRNLSG